MEKLLANQVALVTGASSGMGSGVAKAHADAGAAVVANYHSHAEEAELASDESDYAVGTTLFVDGGMTLYPGFADHG